MAGNSSLSYVLCILLLEISRIKKSRIKTTEKSWGLHNAQEIYYEVNAGTKNDNRETFSFL